MQLNRRGFLCSLAAAGVSGCCCLHGKDERTRVALQLYSVRGLMKEREGFRRTLKAVRDIGYEGVEFAGYGGFQSREIKEMLDNLGLGRAGTHIGIESLHPDRIQETIDFNLGYGNRMLTVSWAHEPKGCRDRVGYWKKLAEDLSTAADMARASGCMVGYHNHQHEFRDKVNGVPVFQLLFDNTSPLVRLQADVGHMVSAGVDPVTWLRRYPGRS